MSQRDEKGILPQCQHGPDAMEQDHGTVLDFLWAEESITGPKESERQGSERQEQADMDGDLSGALARYASWLTGWDEE